MFSFSIKTSNGHSICYRHHTACQFTHWPLNEALCAQLHNIFMLLTASPAACKETTLPVLVLGKAKRESPSPPTISSLIFLDKGNKEVGSQQFSSLVLSNYLQLEKELQGFPLCKCLSIKVSERPLTLLLIYTKHLTTV